MSAFRKVQRSHQHATFHQKIRASAEGPDAPKPEPLLDLPSPGQSEECMGTHLEVSPIGDVPRPRWGQARSQRVQCHVPSVMCVAAARKTELPRCSHAPDPCPFHCLRISLGKSFHETSLPLAPRTQAGLHWHLFRVSLWQRL